MWLFCGKNPCGTQAGVRSSDEEKRGDDGAPEAPPDARATLVQEGAEPSEAAAGGDDAPPAPWRWVRERLAGWGAGRWLLVVGAACCAVLLTSAAYHWRHHIKGSLSRLQQRGTADVPEDARCLARVGRQDWQWLMAPGSAGERAARWTFVAGASGLFLAVAALLLLRAWQSRDAAASTAKSLFSAAMSAFDLFTDALLASQWWRCAHRLWAGLAFVFTAAGALPTLQVARAAAEVAALPPDADEDIRKWAEGKLRDAKALEATVESAPQTYLQGYAMLRIGAAHATPLALASLLFSASMIGHHTYVYTISSVPVDEDGRPAVQWWSVTVPVVGWAVGLDDLACRVGTVASVLCRALTHGLFACAFHSWLLAALAAAALALVASVRYSGHVEVMYALERKGQLAAWRSAAWKAGIVYVAVGMVDLSLTGWPARTVPTHVLLGCAEAALAGAALRWPSEWREAQSAPALAALAWAWGCAWVVHKAVVVRLLQLKADPVFVDLSSNQIGDAGATAIADAVRHSRSLQTLNLGGNEIGDAGATAIAEAVRHSRSLQTLWLDSNQIGDAGATAIAEAVRHSRSLQWLVLSSNRIGDAGATAIADAVRHSRSLQELYLGSNRIGDAGATAIAEAVRHSRSLQVLILSSNDIGAAGATAIAEAVRHSRSLQTLWLNGNGLSEAGKKAVREAWKQSGKEGGLDV